MEKYEISQGGAILEWDSEQTRKEGMRDLQGKLVFMWN